MGLSTLEKQQEFVKIKVVDKLTKHENFSYINL